MRISEWNCLRLAVESFKNRAQDNFWGFRESELTLTVTEVTLLGRRVRRDDNTQISHSHYCAVEVINPSIGQPPTHTAGIYFDVLWKIVNIVLRED